MPDSITLGLAHGPVIGWMDNVNLEENKRRRAQAMRTTDAARPTSQRLTEPMRPSAGTTTDGVSIPRGLASVKPLPFGDRAVVFE